MATSKEIQTFRDLLERWVDQDRAKRLIIQAKDTTIEPKETLSQRSLREAEEFTWQDIQNQKWLIVETDQDISWLDIWVKAWKSISQFWKERKTEWVELPWTLWEAWKAWVVIGKNIIPDAIEATWEVIELISDPVWTWKAVKTTAEWFIEKWLNNIFNNKVWLWILRKLWAPEGNLEKIQKWWFFTEEKKKEAVNAAIQHLDDNFWTLDKASISITEHPVDSILFLKWMISAAKKTTKWPKLDKLETIDKTLSEKLKISSEKQVEQALWTTKEKFKQKWRELAPEILERGIKWSKEEIKQLAEQKSSQYWKEIEDFVASWKLTGTVKRDDLLNVLDDIRKEWQVWDVIIDESIVSATDKFADIISSFGKEIPAEKARIIRQMFDKAVYNTKWIISEESLSLKNNIKKWLWDNIRKQLAEQNPDLAKINKEFNFYNKLDEVLTETLNRQWPQQWWLTWNIVWWGWLWAWAVVFWDLTWAIATAAVAKWLTEAMKSTRWRLVSAGLKNKLAKALASWNKNEATRIATEIIKIALPTKQQLYIWWQATESNLELNK